jgi:hypothetical protein
MRDACAVGPGMAVFLTRRDGDPPLIARVKPWRRFGSRSNPQAQQVLFSIASDRQVRRMGVGSGISCLAGSLQFRERSLGAQDGRRRRVPQGAQNRVKEKIGHQFFSKPCFGRARMFESARPHPCAPRTVENIKSPRDQVEPVPDPHPYAPRTTRECQKSRERGNPFTGLSLHPRHLVERAGVAPPCDPGWPFPARRTGDSS